MGGVDIVDRVVVDTWVWEPWREAENLLKMYCGENYNGNHEEVEPVWKWSWQNEPHGYNDKECEPNEG